MINFVYNTPTKVYFGKDEHLKVGKIIKEYGFQKVLFHYGMSSIKKNGLYDVILNQLKLEGLKVFELGGVEANPKLKLVYQGVKIVKENNIDFILAVGGGSVIDSAKLISVGSKVDFDPWLFSTFEKIPTDRIPLGVILTISASGSAMSNSCVITNDQIQYKRGFNNELNRPLFSILNPELTFSVSKYQTACGVVDILMHTLERFLCFGDSFQTSDYIALGVLKSTIENGLIAYKEPLNYDARANLMWCECLSHNSITGVGNEYKMLVHQLEHEVSGKFDYVAHAAGLSVLFIGYSKYIVKKATDRYALLGKVLFDINNENKEEAANETIKAFEKLFISLNMPTTLSKLNIDESSFEEMANKLTNNKKKVISSIIDLTYDDAIKIYKLCK